jgi:colanic acid/amylovoran biosynthesis glycosyltransferase
LGLVAYADYRELLRSVDICVQPSRTSSDGDTEGGAPTVLLEMQAAGIPVVATRHADIPTVVPDDRYLADEEDVEALADLLVQVSELDDAEWRALLARSRSFIEQHHAAPAQGAEIEAVYREAIGQDSFAG